MFDPARLVFIDETSTSTNMVRLRGRCRRGERLIGRAPEGHWKTVTFVAGLRRNKMVAPFVVDGPMNRASFLSYLEQCLKPTLKRGDTVIIDNLPAHK
jgi:DDE superfamily endonuclease